MKYILRCRSESKRRYNQKGCLPFFRLNGTGKMRIPNRSINLLWAARTDKRATGGNHQIEAPAFLISCSCCKRCWPGNTAEKEARRQGPGPRRKSKGNLKRAVFNLPAGIEHIFFDHPHYAVVIVRGGDKIAEGLHVLVGVFHDKAVFCLKKHLRIVIKVAEYHGFFL